MFYLRYLLAETRRRRGRTILGALGLAVGVALVAAVGALSQGLDDAQDEILEPLTGLGTDLTVTRPLRPSESGEGFSAGPAPADLTPAEQDRLLEENDAARVELAELGDPGDPFERVVFVTSTRLTFPEAETADIAAIPEVERAAPGLTMSALRLEGTVPEATPGPGGDRLGPAAAISGDVDFEPAAVAGVDVDVPALAAVTPDQITEGRWFSPEPRTARSEVVLTDEYAARQGIDVGDALALGQDGRLEVVGLSSSPLGGEASDVYLELGRLQALAEREGRANVVRVRARDAGDVEEVAAAIEATLPGAQVTTAESLGDSVGGSLQDADALAERLGLALSVLAMVAAVLIATLLTLASVTRRTRELGTLRAIGWTRRAVVRQVSLEAVGQGLIGGAIGALLGIGFSWAIGASGFTLSASVPEPEGPGAGLGFGVGRVGGTEEVTLSAPIDLRLVLLAVALAVLGGVIAGLLGGLRAARLRPADALRSVE